VGAILSMEAASEYEFSCRFGVPCDLRHEDGPETLMKGTVFCKFRAKPIQPHFARNRRRKNGVGQDFRGGFCGLLQFMGYSATDCAHWPKTNAPKGARVRDRVAISRFPGCVGNGRKVIAVQTSVNVTARKRFVEQGQTKPKECSQGALVPRSRPETVGVLADRLSFLPRSK
jgi:hypothetical protein